MVTFVSGNATVGGYRMLVGKRMMFAAVFVLSSVIGWAQGQVSFTVQDYDFGTIYEEDGPVQHGFVFINTGSTPVQLQSVGTSCGCTVPRWSNEPVLPGARDTVVAQFNPAGRAGQFYKVITVRANTLPATYRLTIRGEIKRYPTDLHDLYGTMVGPVGFRDGGRVPIATVPSSEQACAQVRGYNFGPDTLALGFTAMPGYAQVKLRRVDDISTDRHRAMRLLPGEPFVFEVCLDGAKVDSWQEVRDRIELQLSILRQEKRSRLASGQLTLGFTKVEVFADRPAEWLSNPPRLASIPAVVELPTVKAGRKATAQIELRNQGGAELIVRSVWTASPAIELVWPKRPIAPGKAAELKVIARTGNMVRGKQTVVCKLITNSPTQRELPFKVEITVE